MCSGSDYITVQLVFELLHEYELFTTDLRNDDRQSALKEYL
jgi:hypothetical protein